MIELDSYGSQTVTVKEFPPFVRVALEQEVRKEVFSRALKKVGRIKRPYATKKDVFDRLYGEKKGKILHALTDSPQSAKTLIEKSELSPSAVYHFLSALRKQNIVFKEKGIYSLHECDPDTMSLRDIIKIEEDPILRRKYGVSIKELELAYFLWDTFVEVAPEDGGYAQTYQSEYTLADAIHRWRTGRTDIPVWALEKLAELSASDAIDKKGSVVQYHLPPGIPVIPTYEGEYKLPIRIDSTLDRILIQLLQKMSKNHLYTFPKRKQWLFKNLHLRFGEFDDTTLRIPSAIAAILKSHYGLEEIDRISARIPSTMRTRWSDLDPLLQLKEKASLLLHVTSLASKSNGGFEITSRSRSFLQDLSSLTSDIGLGPLTVRKKLSRPHFRAYLSESKVDALKRYSRLVLEYPDLEIWLKIPLNHIAETLIATGADPAFMSKTCYAELSRFVESILKSLERKKRGRFSPESTYLQYTERIADHFWKEKLIPSPRRVEELVDVLSVEGEELVSYAY